MSENGIQVDDGDFTRLHNIILEKLAFARFTASEYRCLMFLFRATYGWQKKEDVISLSQWAAGVGIASDKRHNVLRTLQALVAKRVIYTKSHGNNHAATWGFNKHFEEWDISIFQETVISPDNSPVMLEDNSSKETVISPDNKTVISPDNKTVISPDNHKRKKEILKKKESAPKPPPHPAIIVFREVWKRNPNNPQMNSIAKRVTDLDLWRSACQAWGDKGHRPTNIEGMLDWYDHPERFRTEYKPPPNGGDYRGTTPHEARSTNNGVNAVMDYVKDKGLFR